LPPPLQYLPELFCFALVHRGGSVHLPAGGWLLPRLPPFTPYRFLCPSFPCLRSRTLVFFFVALLFTCCSHVPSVQASYYLLFTTQFILPCDMLLPSSSIWFFLYIFGSWFRRLRRTER